MTVAAERLSIAESYRGVRAMVLGASGFIGRWVARSLCDRGAIVHAVVRDRTTAARVFAEHGIAAEVLEADLRHLSTFEAMLKGVAPAIVFNLAGYGVDRTEQDEGAHQALNTQLVLAVSEALRQVRADGWAGQRLIHAGSAQEYGRTTGPVHETTVPQPQTVYGRSKLAATEHLQHCGSTTGLRAVTARLFTVYGPGEHDGRLLPALIAGARSGRPVELTAGEQRRDFTYVEDVAEGLLRLGVSGAPPGAAINLATGRLTSVRAFAEMAAAILGIVPSGLNFGAAALRADEMFHGPVAIDRLRELTAWTPPADLSLGIRRASEFYRTRPHRHV